MEVGGVVIVLVVIASGAWSQEESPPSSGSTIYCYRCGTQSQNTPTCHEFEHLPRWGPFVDTCDENNVCAKSISATGEVVRGCSASQDMHDRRHQDGCRHQVGGGTLCVCKKSYCNHAPATPVSFLLLGLTTVLLNILRVLIS